MSIEDVLYGSDDDADHAHASYETVSLTASTPLHPRRLMAFLDSRPEGLYRIKGFVDLGAADPANRYTVHAVGRFLRFYPEPWPAGESASPTRPDRLRRRRGRSAQGARRLRAERPAGRPDEAGMWGVLRYVQQTEEEPEETLF